MGRRKKEPRNVHRESIASAAQNLFMTKGIEATSMNDIAKEAGYSKATIYVYFQSKEEIVGLLVLESMKKLNDYIFSALSEYSSSKKRYELICQALLRYQEEFPFYFELALDEINIDFEQVDYLPEEKETFRIGEEINQKLHQFLQEGILAGEIRADIKVLPTIMAFWGMLSGLIQVGTKKEMYIKQELQLSKQDFLTYGFDTLYNSIANKEDRQ
ncbi:TetR/AcrR family transcriptional regulator [Anaerosporobacter sp.]|uniref:TetR/AcrR family transcriptional regulator n=1 Tax=Anaerosporobacter sp. TaxID=1872529 RepID=UPI00286F3D1F|nr:TetR/AcrR family transcriptional regulator [Anaerosporobacter sp.]